MAIKANQKTKDEEDNVIEIEVNNNQIEELINKLNKLKNTKSHFHIDIKSGHLLVHHEEDKLK
ncbi:hypothetical protein J4217_04210 [Candidatus Pacearchaeota archaeon]|nr:hypothetical protein [Candidatus Pacearchaeota archaeon]